MTEAEKVICRLYLEDMDKNHTCNEYRLLMELLDKEPCEDAISKRDAIDALRTCYDTETISMDNGDEYINYGDAVGGIEQLPSVEPKIIKCKYCKYYISHCCYERIHIRIGLFVDNDNFCSFAERKTNEID